MASDRSRSLPPLTDGGINPFWSTRVADETRLRYQRPADLPPVPDDGSVVSEAASRPGHSVKKEGKGVGATAATRSRGNVVSDRDREYRSRSAERGVEGRGHGQMDSTKSTSFRTPPSSWTGPTAAEKIAKDDVQTTVERELEKQMFEFFKEENFKLRQELEELKKYQSAKPSNASWSEVEAENEKGYSTPPPPPRRERERIERKEDPRWTPNGTQVPSGPPPVHDELASYEIEEINRAMRWLGPEPSRVVQQEGAGKVMRPSWLDEEAVRLQRVIEEQARKDTKVWQAPYWSTPASVAWKEHGKDQEAPLSRAYTGQGHEMPLSRAQHGQDQGVPLSRACGEQVREVPQSRAFGGGEAGHLLGGGQGERTWSHHGHHEVHQQHQCRVGGELGEEVSSSAKERALQNEIDRLKIELQSKGVDLDRASKLQGEGHQPAVGSVSSSQNDGTMNSTRELPELQGEVTPITLGDWLVTIGPVMRDITPVSSEWWEVTLREAEKAYMVWRQATPMERVSFCPGLPMELAGQKYLRTEQRGVGLLLKAIPADIKSVLVAARELCATTILYRLLTTYQPGGANEKALLLSHLTTTPAGKDLTQLATTLRTWRRYFQRAVEIDTTLPDPTLMVRSLDGPTQGVAAVDSQAAFRLSQMRSQLCLDEKPTQETVYRYSQCVLAEVETLILTRASMTTPKAPSTPPTVKALSQTSPGPTSSPSKICAFWGSDGGCKLGRGCRYVHDWANVSDKSNRCWICSSTLHHRGDCPARSAGGSGGGVAGSSGVSEMKEEKGGKSKGKGGKDHKGKGEFKGGGKTGINKVAANTTQGAGTTSESTPSTQPQQPSGEGKQAEQGSTNSANGPQQETAGLVAEVTSLLKSMRVSQEDGSRSTRGVMKPAISAVRLKRMEIGKESTVLLDGGATNCMRKAKSWKEHEEGVPVQVSLASGTAEMRQDRESGTLLVMQDVQPIVPISDLVKIGVRVEWSSTGCVMSHGGRRLPVYLDAGCPVIGLKEGMELMAQVEEFYKRRSRLRVAAVSVDPNQQDLEMVEAANFATDYPGVPLRFVERIPGKVRWDPELVPLNRRMKKRLQKAKSIVIHLFSGTNTEIWDSHGTDGLVFLNIEIKRGTDLHNDHLFGFLEQLCQSGRVRGVFAGPPCRTVTVLRFQQEEGGPRPLRGREGEARFGLPWLTEAEAQEADDDTVLWLRTLQLMTVALDETMECAIGLEQPEDPAQWKEDDVNLHAGWGYPSFMVWPETVAFAQHYGLDFVHFDQKVLGHKRKKPTTMVTNIGAIKALQGKRSTTPDPPWPRTLRERMEESAGLAEWAPGLQLALRHVAVHLHERYEERRQKWEADRHRRGRSVWTRHFDRQDQRLMALSTKEQRELEEWQQHLNNGHMPFRRDCFHCQESQGRDRQRRRVETPSGYTLNIDISGPYESGFDQECGRFRYFLAATFAVPVRGSSPLAEGLRLCGGGSVVHSAVEREQVQGDACAGDCGELHPGGAHGELHPGGAHGELHPGGAHGVHQREDDFEALQRFCESNGDGVRAPVLGQEPSLEEHPADVVEYLEAGREGRQEELTEVEVREADIANAKWRELIEDLKDVDMKYLTFCIPLRSRQAQEVTRALGLIFVRLRVMSLPVIRCHSDRAKEFVSRPVKAWMANRDIYQTFTAGDESAGSGQVENLVGAVKGRVRAVMKAAKAEKCLWPLAVRFVAEQKLRETLTEMGLSFPPLLPFGVAATAKVKRWHRVQEDGWSGPHKQIRVWGPAADMSMTSRGYYIEVDGKWMRSTVIVRGSPPPQGMELQLPETHPVEEEEADYVPESMCGDDVMQVVDDEEHLHQGQEIVAEEMFPVPANPNPPKRRVTGKQHVVPGTNGIRPVLCVLRTGGEWQWEMKGEDCQGDSNDGKDLQPWQAWLTMVHQGLRKVIFEEKSLTDYENVGEVVMQAEKQVEEIERALRKIEALQQMAVQEECLVTRTVDLAEVRGSLEEWREAIRCEYESLLAHEAIEPISGKAFEELRASEVEIEMIPAKLVATVKPPSRKKARLVGCGNMATCTETDLAASGIDTIGVRALISNTAIRQWDLAVADVKTAFLQAPRRKVEGKCTIVGPPQVVKDLNIMRYGKDEKWVVRGALYGLAESPKDWGSYRDGRLKTMAWEEEGQRFHVEATAEAHIWKVVCSMEDHGKTTEVVAYIGVYVDDLMVSARKDVLDSVLEELGKTFKMAQPEKIDGKKPVTFCGYEITKVADGFEVGQSRYARDMVKRRGISSMEQVACPKVEEGEDEPDDGGQSLREAQQLTGELSWLASRTRPDVMFTVGLMSRLLHRRPAYVCKLGWWLMRYVAGTTNRVLKFTSLTMEEANELVVAVDTSYAPVHENFKSIQGIMMTLGGGKNPLMWTSTRQPFIAQSTAEAELLGYNECVQGVESLSSLLSVFDYDVVKKILGDSKAGISQLANEGGSWRTRHLRIRSAKLRELIQQPGTSWLIRHCDGELLVSDGLTKALQGQKFSNYVKLLGMVDQGGEEELGEESEHHRGQPKVQSMYVVDNKDVMKVALGAGMALVLTDHKALGALLLAVAGVCAFGSERTRLEERPEKIDQRPQQDPDKDKTPQGKRDGAAHLPIGTSVTGRAQEKFWGPLDMFPSVGSSFPGLRAIRVGGKSVGSHGKDGREGAEASTSAADAKPSAADVRSSATDEKPVAADARTFAAGLDEQSVHVKVQRSQGNLQVDVNVHVSGEGGRGYPGRTSTTSGDEGRGNVACDRLAAEYHPSPFPPHGLFADPSATFYGAESGSLDAGVGAQEPHRNPMNSEGIRKCYEEPWELQRFAPPPSYRSDKWDTSLAAYGWYIKIHGKERLRTFHPIHRSTPVETSTLESSRTTVIFDVGNNRQVLHDEWTDSRNVALKDRTVPWRGYTFFKKKVEIGQTTMKATARVDRAEPESPAHQSDGSFEKVSEESW